MIANQLLALLTGGEGNHNFVCSLVLVNVVRLILCSQHVSMKYTGLWERERLKINVSSIHFRKIFGLGPHSSIGIQASG